MEELIKIIKTLCGTVSDTPCGCEECPYFNPEDGFNGDFVCEVCRTLEKYEGD